MKLKLKIKHPKRFWWTLGAVTIVAVVLISGKIRITIPYFHTYRTEFSETCNMVTYSDGRVRLYNHETRKYTTKKLNWIAMTNHDHDTLTVFSLKGMRGYLNLVSGEMQIQPLYRHAWQFSEGVAAVDLKGKIGFIDQRGQTKIPFKFFSPHPFRNPADFLFYGGYCTMIDSSGKYGVIDRKGNWVLKPVFDFVNNPVLGKRVAKFQGKYGLLDEHLKLMIPFECDNLEVLRTGIKVAKGGEQQLLSADAFKVLKTFVYDEITNLQYNTGKLREDGTEILENTGCYAYTIFTKYGLMGPDGRRLTKALFSDVNSINKHLFACKTETYSVTMDSKGRLVEQPKQ